MQDDQNTAAEIVGGADIPAKIRQAAQRLKAGRRVNRVTVRDFLAHFGVERRGAVKVEAIRRMLDVLGLQTEPDFETVWIDQPIRLRLKDEMTITGNTELPATEPENAASDSPVEDAVLERGPSTVEQADEQTNSAPTSEEPGISEGGEDVDRRDPTFRIGSLPAANKRLIVVPLDASVSTAITLMVQHGISQLPVMQGEREVKGVITWKSIACWQAKQTTARASGRVAECREDAWIVDANRMIFDVIPTIADKGYVLVRQPDRRITGIVTESDLNDQFLARSEPFLLIREIELYVRRLIEGRVNADDLGVLDQPTSRVRGSRGIAGLTLGEYILLLERPEIWTRMNQIVDKTLVTSLLHEVRDIRNEIMHFDRDLLTDAQLHTLKRAARFMRDVSEHLQ